MLSSIVFGSIVGLVIGLYTLSLRFKISKLEDTIKERNQTWQITYDLLWMQVREKNDLTYNDMAGLISAMQKTPDHMPTVRETLGKRICGENPMRQNKVGF